MVDSDLKPNCGSWQQNWRRNMKWETAGSNTNIPKTFFGDVLGRSPFLFKWCIFSLSLRPRRSHANVLFEAFRFLSEFAFIQIKLCIGWLFSVINAFSSLSVIFDFGRIKLLKYAHPSHIGCMRRNVLLLENAFVPSATGKLFFSPNTFGQIFWLAICSFFSLSQKICLCGWTLEYLLFLSNEFCKALL